MQLQDFVTPDMVATFLTALVSIVVALAAYGANLLKAYIASKVPANTLVFMKSQASTAVKWLEQSPAFSGEEGARKKQAAVMYLMHIAEQYKIPMTSELADKLVEEAVHDMKKRADDLVEITALAG